MKKKIINKKKINKKKKTLFMLIQKIKMQKKITIIKKIKKIKINKKITTINKFKMTKKMKKWDFYKNLFTNSEVVEKDICDLIDNLNSLSRED